MLSRQVSTAWILMILAALITVEPMGRIFVDIRIQMVDMDFRTSTTHTVVTQDTAISGIRFGITKDHKPFAFKGLSDLESIPTTDTQPHFVTFVLETNVHLDVSVFHRLTGPPTAFAARQKVHG